MKKLLPFFAPAFFTFLALILLIYGLRPQSIDASFDYDRFAKLPMLEGGRFTPIDRIARTQLLIFRGKQYVRTQEGDKIPARQWLAKVMLDPHGADAYPVFRIDHQDLQAMVGGGDGEQKYFSYAELQSHFHTIQTQAQLVDEEAANRDAFQKAILSLQTNLVLYQGLMTSVRPHAHGLTVTEKYEHYMELLKSGSAHIQSGATPAADDPAMKELLEYTREFSRVSLERSPRFIPVSLEDPVWLNLSQGLFSPFQTGELPPILLTYGKLADAYSAGDFSQANQLISTLEELYAPYDPVFHSGKVGYEYQFNRIQPFILCIELYIVIMLTTLVAWVALSKPTLNTAFWILFVTFLIHTAGMLIRMWLMGRPPVTNLYSSAVYVGWGTAGLGLLLEWMFRNGIGSMIAAITGFLSLIIAQHLMSMGDTMEMMRAVLDSNFWLTTHVLTVTIGYSATFVSGFIAIAYFLLGIFTTRLNAETAKSIQRMVYGIVCFGLFFSFVGTFLGGIWADQSWGRFWGWDPKENGALMIVVWNALILHAWRGRIVREKGMMILAIIGNMITAWSWFGTNMLGQGLHSYGFMESALFWLFLFWLTQLAIIFVGAYLPTHAWKSQGNIRS